MTLRESFVRSSLRVSALGRETLALARQATLLRHDLTTVVPTDEPEVAVLVHGFLATAGVLRPLAEALETRAQVAVASFTHPPGIGFVGLAERVGELVARLSARRIHLVGHSIGGLAARWFVQELGGDPRVVQTLSLASPFWGVESSRLLPGPLAEELAPGSPLLARLRAGIGQGVPHYAVSGSHDMVVGVAGALGSVEERIADGCGHNAVLYDKSVQDGVVGWVLRARRAPSSGRGEQL